MDRLLEHDSLARRSGESRKMFHSPGRSLILAFLFVLSAIACGPDQTQQPPTDKTHTPSTSIEARENTAPPAAESGCDRPYSETSIWNLPVDWQVARIHPQSDLMMMAFFAGHGWIGSDTSQYAPNIYWVSNATPLVPVKMREYRFRDAIDDRQIRYGEPGGIVWMPLPPDARPAPGTDAQLAVVNVDTGEEWGIIYGAVDSLGNWSAGGTYRYHIENSGVPPEGFAQRGAGIGQLAGVVRPCEVERGYVDHAVTLAYDYPCAPEVCEANGWPAVIPPFTKTDGKGSSRYDIPEGARIVIRPGITRLEIEQACNHVRGCIVWALAMQEYGGFLVDNSGHPKTYAEGDATAHWDPEVWFSDMLRGLPREWFAVVDWNFPSTRVPWGR